MREKANQMDDFINTKIMQSGPIRVPVMMKKQLAAQLADYLLQHDNGEYDATLEEIIVLGIEATKQTKDS